MKHSNENPSDKELVLHIREFPDDERWVLDLLYRRHREFALNVAGRCLAYFRLDADHSLDIVQDVFLRLPEAIHRLKYPDRFTGYLSTAVYRAALAFCRSHCRCDLVDPSELDEVATPGSDTSINISLSGELFEVLEAILSDRELHILILHARNGLTYSEIAERQSIKEATVRWYVARARNVIKSFMLAGN